MSEIKTLVELFDECQIENVIASLRYKPEKVIFVGYENVMTSRRKKAIERFFKLKGIDAEIILRFTARESCPKRIFLFCLSMKLSRLTAAR